MSEPLATYEWKQIPWRKLEISVFKLQRRIYRASQDGDVRKVHQLQRLLLKSWTAQLLAVRRVTQDNQGKKTAGVDGIKSLNPQQRLALADNLGRLPYGKPLRRVWIPKRGTNEKRPLGIPTLHDRALQALVKLALEPEWEAKFEPNSYGFRPGRSTHDAIGAIFIAINKQPKYVLDADIAKCFDRIDHDALLQKLSTFPMLARLVKRWLQAGVLDQGVFTETEAGTPQGGIVSPLLANIALHGLEAHIRAQFPAQIRLDSDKAPTMANWKPQVIRYADDLVIFHRDRAVIETCQHLTKEWLQRIGLELNPKKTRIAHTLLDEEGIIGFDFFGFLGASISSQSVQHGNGTRLQNSDQTECRRHQASCQGAVRVHSSLPSGQAGKPHWTSQSKDCRLEQLLPGGGQQTGFPKTRSSALCQTRKMGQIQTSPKILPLDQSPILGH